MRTSSSGIRTLTKTIRDEDQLSNVGYSTYTGWEVTGFPITTIRRGEVVYDDGQVIAAAGLRKVRSRRPIRETHTAPPSLNPDGSARGHKRRADMTMRTMLNFSTATVGFAILLAISPVGVNAGQEVDDNDDIGGVVTSANGPEAAVWVIAETTDLDTKFVKIVVTDDQGRYLLPDLPTADFTIWVRGYGLVDSPKIEASPGRIVDLTATVAPNARAAAEYYPAGYWLSLLEPPDASEFPGTGTRG